MYSKAFLKVQNNEATVNEFKRALELGALTLAADIFLANPDLQPAFRLIGGKDNG